MLSETILACLAVVALNFALWRWVNPRHFGQDVASLLCMADHALRGKVRLYGDCYPTAPGLVIHLMVFIKFFGKENQKAFAGFFACITGVTGVAVTLTGAVLSVPLAGLAGGLLMVAYLSNPRINGNWGAFEQLMALPISLALLCLCLTPLSGSSWPVFIAGLCFGYATLIRLFALVYLPSFIIVAWWLGLDMVPALAGLALVQVLPIAWFALRGRVGAYLATYYLQTLFFVLSPKKYRETHKVSDTVKTNKIRNLDWNNVKTFSLSLLPLLILAAAGIVAGFGTPWQPMAITCLTGLAAGVLLIFLRGEALPQFWQNFLIWLCLPGGFALAGTVQAIAWPPAQPAPLLALLAVAWLFAWAISKDRHFYYRGKNPYGWLQKAHGDHMVKMYQAHRMLAERIKQLTKPEDRILLVGKPTQILLHCGRDHFLPDFYLPRDYLEKLYAEKDSSPLKPINQWLGFDLAPARPNPFESGDPALIISADGSSRPDLYCRLLKAPLERVAEFPELAVWRVSRDARDLLALYTEPPLEGEDMAGRINHFRRRLVESFDRRDLHGVWEALHFLIRADPPARFEYTLVLGDYMFACNKLGHFLYLCENLLKQGVFTPEQSSKLTEKVRYLQQVSTANR